MYEETNVLEQFKRDMETIVDGKFKHDVPELPRVGKLELAQVVDSAYFFG